MPSGAKILTAQVQNDTLCLWAIVPVDHNFRFDSRIICVVGTGNVMPEPSAPHLTLNYIATAQQYGGGLVWHVFEEK